MKIAPVADVKARLSAYLEECETEGIITKRRSSIFATGGSLRFLPLTRKASC